MMERERQQNDSLVNGAGSADKQIKQYQGYGHCILAEPPGRAALVEADIKRWLLERAAADGGQRGGGSRGGVTAWREADVPGAKRRLWAAATGGCRVVLILVLWAGFAYCWRGHLRVAFTEHALGWGADSAKSDL